MPSRTSRGKRTAPSGTPRTRSSSSSSGRMAWIGPAASRGVRSTSTTSCKMSSGRSLHGRSGSGSRRWPPTALRRRICTLRFPRKRSRSRRKSLRRRSDDGPSDDDSGVAEPRNLEEDRRDSGGRRLHAGEARGIEARAPREVHPEKGGRESPQETRHRPRGGEACPEAREGGQARSPREEALGQGYGGGAGSAPHNSREGTAAHLGRAGDHGRVEGDRPVAPAVRRDGAIEENSRTLAQQETPSGSPPKNLREVRSPRDRRQRIGRDRVRAIDRRTRDPDDDADVSLRRRGRDERDARAAAAHRDRRRASRAIDPDHGVVRQVGSHGPGTDAKDRDGDRDDLPRGHRLDRDGPREHARPRIPGRSPYEVAGRHLVGTRGEAEEARRDPGGPTPGRERGEEGEGPRRRGG